MKEELLSPCSTVALCSVMPSSTGNFCILRIKFLEASAILSLSLLVGLAIRHHSLLVVFEAIWELGGCSVIRSLGSTNTVIVNYKQNGSERGEMIQTD